MENELKIFTWLRESEQWVSDAQTIIGEQKIRIDHLEENLRMKTVILEATRRSLDKAKEVLEDERHLHKKEKENLLNSLQLYRNRAVRLSRKLEGVMKEKKYLDNEKGVISALRDLSDGIDFTDVSAIPDPQVIGVWKVFTPSMPCDWIVYLKGYHDPFGNIREFNDFEDCPRS